MFGKTKEAHDVDGAANFFGDESAAAEASKLDELAHRVHQVESQINSQFTSLAAYAQISQEQVELARSEASMAVTRSERRVIELIERERADRLQRDARPVPAAPPDQPSATGWASPDVDARLQVLETAVAEIRHGLGECLARQKALADAITDLFEPVAHPNGAETLPPPPTGDGGDTIDGLSLS